MQKLFLKLMELYSKNLFNNTPNTNSNECKATFQHLISNSTTSRSRRFERRCFAKAMYYGVVLNNNNKYMEHYLLSCDHTDREIFNKPGQQGVREYLAGICDYYYESQLFVCLSVGE